MWHFIHRKNIELYRKKLETAETEEERARIAKLLAEEEAKQWQAADDPEPDPLR